MYIEKEVEQVLCFLNVTTVCQVMFETLTTDFIATLLLQYHEVTYLAVGEIQTFLFEAPVAAKAAV